MANELVESVREEAELTVAIVNGEADKAKLGQQAGGSFGTD